MFLTERLCLLVLPYTKTYLFLFFCAIESYLVLSFKLDMIFVKPSNYLKISSSQLGGKVDGAYIALLYGILRCTIMIDIKSITTCFQSWHHVVYRKRGWL